MLAALLPVACAVVVPPSAPREPVAAIAASAATPLGAAAARAAAAAGPPAGRSGFLALPQAGFALDARLELMRRARASLDVQCYLIGRDATGLLLLRELRDAARRGVRVRLLVDDLYTAGMDPLLAALAAEPGVSVSVFNPFAFGRDSIALRALGLLADFERLNHRMHNKLLVADGAFAVVGGRNLADEYFLRSPGANFIDFDALATGPVVADLARIYDRYWNSEHALPIGRVAAPSTLRGAAGAGTGALEAAAAGIEADARAEARLGIAEPARPSVLPGQSVLGTPPLGAELDAGLPHLHGPRPTPTPIRPTRSAAPAGRSRTSRAPSPIARRSCCARRATRCSCSRPTSSRGAPGWSGRARCASAASPCAWSPIRWPTPTSRSPATPTGAGGATCCAWVSSSTS